MASRGLLRFHHSRFPTLLVRNTLIRTQGYATCTVATSTCESFSSRRLFPRAVHNGNFRSQRLVLSFPYGVRPRSSFPSEELMIDKFAAPTPSATAANEMLCDAGAGDVAIGTADVATSASDVVAGTFNSASELMSVCYFVLCNYTPVGVVDFLFVQAHFTLGMPWVPAIISVTMLYRAVAFSLYLVWVKNSIELRPISAALSNLRKEHKAVRETLGEEAAGEVIRRAQRLHAKYDFTKRTYWFVITPMAIHQCAFSTLMLALLMKTKFVPITSMKTGGLWFFSDLTVPDPLFVLPVVAVALSLLNTTKLIPGTDAHYSFGKKYVLVFRAVSVLGLPIIAFLPAAMQLLLVSVSGSFTLCQLTFRISAMRRFIGIPTKKLEPGSKHIRALTFWEIIEEIKEKFGNRQSHKSEKYTVKTCDHNPLAGEKRDLSENEKSKNPGKEKVRKSGKIAVQAKRQKAKRRKI